MKKINLILLNLFTSILGSFLCFGLFICLFVLLFLVFIGFRFVLSGIILSRFHPAIYRCLWEGHEHSLSPYSVDLLNTGESTLTLVWSNSDGFLHDNIYHKWIIISYPVEALISSLQYAISIIIAVCWK